MSDEQQAREAPMMTAYEVAARLNCSWRTVYRLAARGEMPGGRRVGWLRRWTVEEIEQWIAAGCPRMVD